jgi:hypothetical protein
MGLFNKKKSATETKAEGEAKPGQERRRSSIQQFAERTERKLSAWSNKDEKPGEAGTEQPRRSSRIAKTQATQAAMLGAGGK